MAILTEKTIKIIDSLLPEGELDTKIKNLLIEDIRRRLAEFELIDRHFQKKYGLTLTEFENKNVVNEKGYSFEVESDYHEWDSAVDAVNTLKNYLDELS